MYSYPDDPVGGLANTPCILDGACQQLDDSLKTSLLDPNSSNAYDYCDKTNDFNKGSSYKGCVDCLKSTKNQRYFANCESSIKPL